MTASVPLFSSIENDRLRSFDKDHAALGIYVCSRPVSPEWWSRTTNSEHDDMAKLVGKTRKEKEKRQRKESGRRVRIH
jgi:hypothetical protein